MAEIWHANDHNSSSTTGREIILVSSLWFSRLRNSMTSSDLTDYRKTWWRSIWRKIWHLNDHNSSSMTARDPILVSTLWFSRSRNSIMSSDLTLDDQKNKIAANMAKFGIENGYISSSMTARDLMLVSLLWFSRSRNSMTSSELPLGDQKIRRQSIWRKICHSHDHNSSFMTGIVLILVSSLWFSGSRNTMMSSYLTFNDHKNKVAEILY